MTKVQFERVTANPPGKDQGQDKNAEFAEIKILEGSLAGYTLQDLANPGTPHQVFKTYHAFPRDFPAFKAGTIVRIHSGSGTDGWVKGVYCVFKAGEHGKGVWHINNTGDILRVIDATGTELARRVLTGKECEAPTVLGGSGAGIIVATAGAAVGSARAYGGGKAGGGQ